MGEFRDYYADLGLNPNASPTAIKTAFHAFAKKHHPDKSGLDDTSTFRHAREAFEKLSDFSYRAAYDRDYWHEKLQTDENNTTRESNFRSTRTAQYEAEEEARASSPPPRKPIRRPNKPNWQYFNGKAYQKWQKLDEAYRMRHPERNQM